LVDEQAERIAELEAAYEIALDQLRKDVERIAELEANAKDYGTVRDIADERLRRIAELEAEKELVQGWMDAYCAQPDQKKILNHFLLLHQQIERVKALPDQWRRAGSLMIDAERCLTDLEEALEGE